MIKPLILISCLALASCGAQPLRTSEEAAAEAVSQAVESTVVASHAMEEANTEAETVVVAITEKTTYWRDPQYGCEYIITPEGGITPRMMGFGQNSDPRHVCQESSN